MSDDRYKNQEQIAKEEAYREYLRLRQETRKTTPITETPYGASELRKRMKEQEAQKQAYMRERAAEEEAASRKKFGRGRRGEARRRSEEEALFRNADRQPRPERKTRKRPKSKLRTAIIILIILVFGLGALTVCAFGMAAATLGKIGDLDINKRDLEISQTAASNLDDYNNIAVLGVDARNVDDDSDSRSDAIVIVSINKKTNEIKMFSVFRDTLLDLGGDAGLDKITHAYFYGGAQRTLQALNKNMDLNIDKAVVINWKTVAEVIDALGGITIDIQESEIEEMNKYIGGTAKTTGSEKKKIKHAGKQKLNGAQAVTYARIRKDAATGDYRRNERMKIVMAKTFKKAKKADIFTLKEICDNAFPQAKTNISTRELMSMALKFKSYDMTSSTTGWPYDVSGWMGYAGAGYAWYGPPVTLSSNVSKLYDKFFEMPDYEPTETVRTISENISTLTGLY
ncbi:MAG: LCP family protein [Firmicutes bacterium]|nr:LCP family protein [Bacillota bacterium]